MDHDLAVKNRAVERYLLQEMEEEERDAFESHYFVCAMCAEDVKTADVLIQNAKVVFEQGPVVAPVMDRAATPSRPGWLSWWPSLFAHPAFAMALCLVAAYPWLFVIPGYRSRLSTEDQPRAVQSVFLRSESRGDAVQIHASGPGQILLTLDVNAPENVKTLTAKIQSESASGPVSSFSTPVPPAGESLHLLLPASSLRPGRYMLLLMAPPSGSAGEVEVGRYRFEVQ